MSPFDSWLAIVGNCGQLGFCAKANTDLDVFVPCLVLPVNTEHHPGCSTDLELLVRLPDHRGQLAWHLYRRVAGHRPPPVQDRADVLDVYIAELPGGTREHLFVLRPEQLDLQAEASGDSGHVIQTPPGRVFLDRGRGVRREVRAGTTFDTCRVRSVWRRIV